MNDKPYSEKEDKYLKENYLTKSKAEMAKELGRTPRSIEKHLLSVLKLKKTYEQMGLTRKKESCEKNTKTREKLRGSVPDEWFEYPASHNEGQKAGNDYYFTGRKCEAGHIAPRRVHGRGCLECGRINSTKARTKPSWKEWRKAHRKKPEIREKENARRQKRLEDAAFRIRINASTRISNAMNRHGRYKPVGAEKLLGCSWSEFITYIETQFDNDMNLNNHGKKGWHLDHIRPCDSFDLLSDEQIYVCFNWRNFQPMWAVENQSKNNDYSPLDETEWVERMLSLGYEGELFLKYEEGNSY